METLRELSYQVNALFLGAKETLEVNRTSVVLLCGLVALSYILKRRRNLPPGPLGWPIVGNMPAFVKASATGKLANWIADQHERYGDIISLQTGWITFVMVKDGNLMKELYNSEDFKYRPLHFPLLRQLINGRDGAGVIFNNGEKHKAMRVFALSGLHDLGVGKVSLDDVIQTEAELFVDHMERLSKEGGHLSRIQFKTKQITANIIHNLVFGFRYEYDDRKYIELVTKIDRFFATNVLGFMENFFPAINWFPTLRDLIRSRSAKTFFALDEDLKSYVLEQIEEHKRTYTEGEIRDFVDLFVKNEKENKEFYTASNMSQVILDLFRGGTDTTAAILSWCILYLMKFPEIQEELQSEIDEQIGDQIFQRSMKEKIPKTMAFLHETLRIASVALQTTPHTCVVDTKVGGYTVPAQAMLLGSLYTMHHDKDYWDKPEEFSLNRWFNSDGQLLKHSDHFMPFSTGKRVCIGKQLSGIEQIIFLVKILQSLRFENIPGQELTNKQAVGLLRCPVDYSFKVSKRF